MKIFVSGFFTNAFIAIVFTMFGERLDVDISLAAIFVFVYRIFNNLSFTIKPNSNVAFVGRSVSGKSTILNLMSKMYEVDSGKVLIDGVDIKKMEKSKMLGPSMNCLKIIPNLEVCFMLKNPKIK